jgi:G3E family GTPase
MTIQKPVDKPIPVTLISGFLGSGKTTLLENILKTEHGFKIAVIINDISSFNVDAELISSHKIVTTKEKIIKFQNGCICCTLRGDLLEELIKIVKCEQFDYIIIESTGIGEPMQVAETFTQEFSELMLESIKDDEDEIENYKLFKEIVDLGGLNKIAHLDTCITVVDAINFSDDIETTDYLADRWGSKNNLMNEEDRTVTDLLVDQIEFSDVVIINKASGISKRLLKKVKKIVKTLNPVAEIITTNYSKVSNKQLLNTKLFNFTKAVTSSGWLRSLEEANSRMGYGDDLDKKRITPKPETEEYGINNFVYRARKPFHPKKLYDLLCDKFQIIERINLEEEEGEAEGGEGEEGDQCNDSNKEEETDEEEEEEGEENGEEDGEEEELTKEEILKNKKNSPLCHVVRSKGFFWLATRYILRGEWSSAGSMLTLSAGTPWFGAMAKEFWPTDRETIKSIKLDYEGVHEDRRQEIVFIGFKINPSKIQKMFDDCLLTDEEYEEYNKVATQKNLIKIEKELATMYEDGFEDWDFVAEGDE